MVVRLPLQLLADGTWGKVHVRGKAEQGRAKAMTQLLTSSTCRNRYTYGWRLCTVTYFPRPLEQGNESFSWYSNSVSQLSSLLVEIYMYLHIFFVHYRVYNYRIIPPNYKTTLHFMFKITTCRTVTHSFKFEVNPCTIALWRYEQKMTLRGAMLSPRDWHYLWIFCLLMDKQSLDVHLIGAIVIK